MNTRWFKAALADKKITQRELAKRMELDPASISLMLQGKRRMQLGEAAELAGMLGCSLSEVIRAAGIDVSTSKEAGALQAVLQKMMAHANAYAQECSAKGDMIKAGAVYDDLRQATTILGPLLTRKG